MAKRTDKEELERIIKKWETLKHPCKFFPPEIEFLIKKAKEAFNG